jgi:hypothetical protein
MTNKIIDLAKSRKPVRVKFKAPMPYRDDQIAVGYLDVVTGDCVFFHENGKFWGYKKYNPTKEVPNLLAEVAASLKWASKNASPGSEL